MRSSLRSTLAASALLLVLFPAAITHAAQATSASESAPFDVRAHYTKSEYRIKMRDGVNLFTIVYAPKDTSKSYPFLLTRTCYSIAPYGPDAYRTTLGPSRQFEESGYIFVYQDVRGRYESEGVYAKAPVLIDHPTGTQHDESTDAYDTVAWLLKNIPNNNGRVGVYGTSMPGLYAAAAMINGHPAIKAASPQAPVTDYRDNDDYYHNGALMLESRSFFGNFRLQHNPVLPERPTPLPYATADAYTSFLHQWEPLSKAKAFIDNPDDNPYFDEDIDHPNYDSFWVARDLSRHLHNIHAAVLLVGGLFDEQDLSGPWKEFYGIAKQSPTTSEHIVEGPWIHGGWNGLNGERIADVQFGSDTGDYFREKIEFPFFEHYLKDAPDPNLATATVFETGTNVWRSYTAWPPPGSKPRMIYFQPGGKLSFDPPPPATKATAYDQYTSDPAHPVPEVSYAHAPGPPRDYMVDDQRFAATRPDVLVYETDPLTEDVTFAGPLRAKLFVSTSGTDSDFDVKLIDVYPKDFSEPGTHTARVRPTDALAPPDLLGSYEQLIRGEPMRGKFRHSQQTPQPFTPGKVEALDFSLVQVNHTFLKGHRIMVQVQSTWFPLTDLNPQTFVDIPLAKPGDFKLAVERVYHTAQQPSGLQFQALP